jgi:hypothetical protein
MSNLGNDHPVEEDQSCHESLLGFIHAFDHPIAQLITLFKKVITSAVVNQQL